MIGLLVAAAALAAGREESGGKKAMRSMPKPQLKGGVSLEEAIAARRSVRAFADRKLDENQMSQLAWAAQGVTDQRRGHRAAPSAGALYPLEMYLVTAEGTYRYHPAGHEIELVREQDLRGPLSRAALGQRCVSEAPLSVVIAGVYERVTRKYGQRGVLYTHIEVGHAAQNVHLQAVALGLGSVPVGAFDEKAVAEVLGLPKDEVPLYIIPVGYPR